ncbi:hypothetical protein ACH5RR_033300 [Cinchona calisaya]|uniref:Uncharacterized protein n=1 Tax=Cinchona calisaya TaxID=153742 RepID=A0ABD2YQU7_9GENT
MDCSHSTLYCNINNSILWSNCKSCSWLQVTRVRSPEPEPEPEPNARLHDMYEDDENPHLPMPPYSLAGFRASMSFSSDQCIRQDTIPLESSSSIPFRDLDGMSRGTGPKDSSQLGFGGSSITFTRE